MVNNLKICPFIKQACVVGKCEIYNETLKRCNISVLPYNIYRLSMALAAHSESPEEQSPVMFGKNLDLSQPVAGLKV
jgi:hypothetical protein